MALINVLVDELRDMYSAENQLVKALPKLTKGAKNAQLKALFTTHLEETKEQVLRLKEVFEGLLISSRTVLPNRLTKDTVVRPSLSSVSMTF
jgi:ferritin-like metal-binding protein YciE